MEKGREASSPMACSGMVNFVLKGCIDNLLGALLLSRVSEDAQPAKPASICLLADCQFQ